MNHQNRGQIDFLSNRTRVMAELRFLRFWSVSRLKISPISKKVNLQNRCQIDFLSKRTRLMAKLRFLEPSLARTVPSLARTVF